MLSGDPGSWNYANEMGTLESLLRKEIGTPVLVFKDYGSLDMKLSVRFHKNTHERIITVSGHRQTMEEYVNDIKTAYLKTYPEDFL